MASPSSPLILFTLLIIVTAAVAAAAAEPNLNIVTDAFDFETAAMSLAAGEFTDGGEDQLGRRSLFWKAMRYYISYGALSANRIPCPPRSGRSYYTHNCFNARGPVHPYTRGCSAITRCRR